MPGINYAKQYGRELANAYPYLSHYGDLWNGGESQRFKPLMGKTVYIPSMKTTGARAANRDQITGTFNRNFAVDWEAHELSMDREWDTLVDPLDVMETNEVATIANVTKTFNEFQKVPEQDAYMSSKLAGFAQAFGGINSTTLTDSNILGFWDAALAYMTDQRVNRDRVRCKVIPAIYKLLKEATGLTRFIDVTGGIRNVDRNVGKLDGVLIEEIPSDLMQTAYDFSDGWAAAAGASQIGMILYDSMSIAAPIVYDTAMISAPSAQSKGKYLYYERYYYDVFCLMNRQAGVFAFVGAPSLGTLTVTSVAGTEASGDTIITVSGTQFLVGGGIPEGYELVVTSGQSAAVSETYGAVPLATETWVEKKALQFKLASQTSGKYATVALVNKQTGFVVAGGNAVIVAKA
jgi:hypothetical protein